MGGSFLLLLYFQTVGVFPPYAMVAGEVFQNGAVAGMVVE